jgi:hypothetical protein
MPIENKTLIDTEIVTPTPYAELVAQGLIDVINFEINRRVAVQIDSWKMLWENPNVTPPEVLAALGSNATIVFAVATENCYHIGRAAEAVGKNVSDYLPAKYLSVPDAYKQ